MQSPGLGSRAGEVVTLLYQVIITGKRQKETILAVYPQSFHLQQISRWDHGALKSQAWGSASYLHEDTSGQKCWLSSPIILHEPK